MRKIYGILIASMMATLVYAGDMANFVNLGFSADGTKFAFGQYGLQDKTYRAYAELYIIDTVQNVYADNGIFRISPTKLTAQKESKITFLNLQNRAQAALNKWNIAETRQGRVLYVQTDSNAISNNGALFFRDFQTNNEYRVVLYSTQKRTSSSFYLTVEKIRPNGSKIEKQIGRPDYFRSGVRNYTIKKILIDETERTLIFVIEKTEKSESGDSFRYMVETAILD